MLDLGDTEEERNRFRLTTALVHPISRYSPGGVLVAITNNYDLDKMPSDVVIERIRELVGWGEPRWFLSLRECKWRVLY